MNWEPGKRYRRTVKMRLFQYAWVSPDTDCIEWTSHRNSLGYGALGVDGTSVLAHRMAYEVLVGPIPNGLTLDHLCRNTSCVNPDHLEPVTPAENVHRRNAFMTHCRRGHPPLRRQSAYRANWCPAVPGLSPTLRRRSPQQEAGDAVMPPDCSWCSDECQRNDRQSEVTFWRRAVAR